MSDQKKKQDVAKDLAEVELAKDEILAKIAAKIGANGKSEGSAVSAHASHASGSKHNSITH